MALINMKVFIFIIIKDFGGLKKKLHSASCVS